MASTLWILLASPLNTLQFIYTFITLVILALVKRIFLPQLPSYQDVRTQVFRAYLISAGCYLPSLPHGLPVSATQEEAKLVRYDEFEAYIIPGISEIESSSCVVLFAHGGGYASGEARMYLDHMKRWKGKGREMGLDITFFSVEYTLTNMASHPCQQNEFVAAYKYLLSLKIEPSKVVFMGDSAGAGLCLIAGAELARQDRPQPAGYILLSPWIDHTNEPYEGGNPCAEVDYLIRCNEAIPKYSKFFIGDLPADSPAINPLCLDGQLVKKYSRQLILTGGADFALYEARQWVDKLRIAGVECRFVREWGQFHRYALGSRWLSPGIRDKTDDSILSWLQNCVGERKQG